MMPGNVLSTETVLDFFEAPRNITKVPLVDYELGGVAINDPSQGLSVKVWRAFVEDNTFIKLEADGVSPFVLIAGADITEVSLAFDQQMRPHVAYVEADRAKFYWFDTVAVDFATMLLDVDAINPRVALDERRPAQVANSDVILAYILDDKLCTRLQRDRFEDEYEMDDLDPGTQLVQIGKNRAGRFQFRIKP